MGGFNINLGCLVLIATAAAMAAPPPVEGAVSCGRVESSVSPCLDYVKRGGAVVPPPCCDGVRAVYAAAPTKADREAVCGCIKTIAPRGARVDYINDVIRNCGVTIPFRYSPNVDCSRVL